MAKKLDNRLIFTLLLHFDKMSQKLLKIFLITVCLTLGFVLPSRGNQEKMGVVVSIAPLAQWAKAVGGNKVNVMILVPPGANPHTYEPLPSQLIKVNKSRVFIKNGAGLEFWADKVVKTNKKIVVVDISRNIKLLRLSSKRQKEEHLFHDPHLWLSIRNAEKGVKEIYQTFSRVDPINKGYYLRNMNCYQQRLKKLDKEITEKLKSIKNKKFIVFHPAWTYFCRDYGLLQIPIERQGKEPSPKYLARIIKKAREDKIRVIFVEPQFNPKSARVIAKEINGAVLSIDPLSENYIENTEKTVEKLLIGLE